MRILGLNTFTGEIPPRITPTLGNWVSKGRIFRIISVLAKSSSLTSIMKGDKARLKDARKIAIHHAIDIMPNISQTAI